MYFKLKDAVTAGNGICGLASTVAVMEGHVFLACLLVCISWAFDALDGVVARLTNTFNKFGGEFDNMCDHLSYGIAPGFIVYAVYRDWMPGPDWVPMALAAALGFWLPMTASVRGARLASKPIKVKGFWIGLPRPVSAFVAVTFFQTSLFTMEPTFGHWFGILLVVALGASNLGAFPFLSHHGHVWRPWVTRVIISVPITLGLTLLLGPIAGLAGMQVLPNETFFDLFFFWLFGYSLFGWAGIPAEDWKRVRDAVRVWRDAPEPE